MSQKKPGGPRGSQAENPGRARSARRSQEEPGGARGVQEEPRRSQEEPGRARRSQEEPRRSQGVVKEGNCLTSVIN